VTVEIPRVITYLTQLSSENSLFPAFAMVLLQFQRVLKAIKDLTIMTTARKHRVLADQYVVSENNHQNLFSDKCIGSTLSLTTALEGVRGQRHVPAALNPRERPGTHCTGGWVGPRAGLGRCGKSAPPGIRSPDHPARSQSLYRLRYPAHALV